MAGVPRITIVTSSFNQGAFIARTIDSVRAQQYPNLEHIVVDGMSTDETMSVLAGYEHLMVIREPDAGQADAINKGFRAATGDIFGFLNSDDTLEPGTLDAVARELSPGSGHDVVMGRCRFIDEDDRFLGVEHPSAFESHRRVVEIWKGYAVPQPAVFWRRSVWDACGPLRVDEPLVLDYDLFCRFSAKYRFHRVNQIFANYRLHTQSKTTSISDAERLEKSIAVSRRYWGSPVGAQYWRVLGSYLRFRADRRGRAARLLRAGRESYRRGARVAGLARIVAGGVLAPDVAADVSLPALRPALRHLRRLTRVGRRRIGPQTEAWFGHHAIHSDGWAGPTLISTIEITSVPAALVLTAAVVGGRLPRPLVLEAFADGRSLGRRTIGRKSEFEVEWGLDGLSRGTHEVRLAANTFVVPHEYFGNQDFRPLSYRVVRLGVREEAARA
jgi:glycosyltransferase involved in cell wall biosynthesis